MDTPPPCRVSYLGRLQVFSLTKLSFVSMTAFLEKKTSSLSMSPGGETKFELVRLLLLVSYFEINSLY